MLTLGLATLALLAGATAQKTVLGYYTNWSQYRNGVGKFLPENLDGTVMTHAAYGFAKILPSTYEVEAFEWNDKDEEWAFGMFTRFHDNLWVTNPGAKSLLSLGGWNFSQQTTIFNDLAATAATREAFVDSCISFAHEHEFQGIDMDWEYPKAADLQNFNTLMFLMREKFEQDAVATGGDRLLLAAAVSANVVTFPNSYDGQFGAACDWVGLMTYDLFGQWDTVARNHAQLYQLDPSDHEENAVGRSVDHWVSYVGKDKVVVGLATYGRAVYVTTPNQDTGYPCGMMSTLTGNPGPPGPITGEAGFFAYYEIMDAINNGGAQLCEDMSVTMSAVMTDGTKWIGFDTVNTLAAKVAFILDREVQGVMFWAIDLDDFHGGYPLMKSVYQAINGGVLPPPYTTHVPRTTITASTAVTTVPVTTAPAPTTAAPVSSTAAAGSTAAPASTSAAPSSSSAPNSTGSTCIAIASTVTDAWCQGVNCDATYVDFCQWV